MQGAVSAAERSLRSVFVGNIPYEATEEQLRDIFAEVGPVISFRLIDDKETGKPKGYGFCEYKDQDTAMSAMRNLNGYELNGRILRVDNAANEKNKEELKNLQASLGGPPVESPYGNECDPDKAPEAISKAVASLPPEQMFELMKQMKLCIQNNPNEARNMLLQNPQLAYALLQAQVVMRIVEPTVAMTMLHRPNTNVQPVMPNAEPPPPAMLPQTMQGPQGPSNHQSLQQPGNFGGPRFGGNVNVMPNQNQGPPGPHGPMMRQALLGERPQLGAMEPPRNQGGAPPMGQFNEPRGPPSRDFDMRGDPRGFDPRPMGERDSRMGPATQMGGGGLPMGRDNREPIRDPREMRDPRGMQHESDVRGLSFDPRSGRGMDPRTSRAPGEFDQRNCMGGPPGPFDQRPQGFPDRQGNGFDQRNLNFDQRDPRSQGMAAGTGRGPQPVPPINRSGPPTNPNMGSGMPPGPIVNQDQEKAALIMQVLQLSDQQIAMLPPEQRQSIMVLKEQIARSTQ